MKDALFIKQKSSSYNYINEEVDDVEIMRGCKFLSEEREGLTKLDDSDEGSEVIITAIINDDTRLDACKGPTTFEEGEIWLLKVVHQVITLAVKPRIIVQQRYRRWNIRVQIHINLQVCDILHASYLFVMLIVVNLMCILFYH